MIETFKRWFIGRELNKIKASSDEQLADIIYNRYNKCRRFSGVKYSKDYKVGEWVMIAPFEPNDIFQLTQEGLDNLELHNTWDRIKKIK